MDIEQSNYIVLLLVNALVRVGLVHALDLAIRDFKLSLLHPSRNFSLELQLFWLKFRLLLSLCKKVEAKDLNFGLSSKLGPKLSSKIAI
jgi:hypothetical protein